MLAIPAEVYYRSLMANEVINGKGKIRNDRTQPVSSGVQRPVRTRTGGRGGEIPVPDGTGQASAGGGGQGRTNTGVARQSHNRDRDAFRQVVPLVEETVKGHVVSNPMVSRVGTVVTPAV